MKLNKFIPITLLAGVLMLSACGANGSDTNEDKENKTTSENNSSVEINTTSENSGSVENETTSENNDSAETSSSTQAEPVYTITEAEFSALKLKLSDPKIFVEDNFTIDMTYGGVSFKNKLANGKVDFFLQGEHFALDLDVSTYNPSTKKANGDIYEYDDSEEKWSKQTGEIDVYNYASLSLGFEVMFSYAPSSLDDFTYNKDTRQYSGSRTEDGTTIVTKFMVKDGQFLSYETVGIVDYEFSDYGTTTVTLPTVA